MTHDPIVGVNGLDEARRLAFAWTETAPPTEAAICAGWNAIAEQLSSALSERNDDRFKIMAFVHRHSIIEALTRPVPTDAAIRADEREKCAKVIDTMPSQMKPRDGCRHVICDEAADRLEAQAAEIERLREALGPFAKALDDWGDDVGHADRWNTWEHPISVGVTLGDFRRARQALQQGQNNE